MSKGMGFVNYDSEIRSMYSERLSEWVSGFPDVEVARLVDVTYNAARQDGEARYQIGDRTDNHFYELHFKADRELTYLRLNKVIEVENLIVSDLWAGVHEFASEKAMNEEAVD